MLGSYEVVEQQGLTKFEQKAASAWSSFDGSMTYVGRQIVKGVNHLFIAEQTLILNEPERHIVFVTINEFNDSYSLVGIERLI